MSVIKVAGRNDAVIQVAAREGASVMECLREAGVDELQALCGGVCACATCHVYVDEADLGRLPPMGPDEDDLLGALEHRTGRSRLSCQIAFSTELSGLSVKVAPEE